jgi:hypothetical protein
MKLKSGTRPDFLFFPDYSDLSVIHIVPDRPLVRVPIRTLLEYPYELGVWDFDPVHIVISSQVLCHDGSLLHSKIQYTTLDYSSQLF